MEDGYEDNNDPARIDEAMIRFNGDSRTDANLGHQTYYIYDDTGSFVELLEAETPEEVRSNLDSEGKEDWTFASEDEEEG